MRDVYIKDDARFYDIVKKYIKHNKVLVHLSLEGNDITDDSILKKQDVDIDTKFKIWTVHAINLKNIDERYSYIYDIVCDYLDNEFITKDICGFKDNVCKSVKNKSHCSDSLNGCCYGHNRGLCPHFQNNKCTIKSLSCKLFTCRYLKKNHISYKVNDIVLLKYFFNLRQKFIISTSIFKDKSEILLLLKKYK